MTLTARERAIYFDLLERYTSLGVVSLFLKSLNLPSSAGTWVDMREKRLEPAIVDSRISRSQLLRLLSDAEEFGHQNIFLFRCNQNTASQLVNEDTLKVSLGRLERLDLLEKPPVILGSENFQLTEARLESIGDRRRALVVKGLETRDYWKKVKETETDGRKIKEYERRVERAVNVAKLYDDGLLEIRIQSYEQAADYVNALQAFWSQINPIIGQRSFEQVSLKKFKDYLLDNHEAFKSRITYAPILAENEGGFTMALGVPNQAKSLFENDGATASFAAFSEHEASIRTANFIWKKQATGKASRHIHIRIAGSVNQFQLLVASERADYEHFFQEVKDNCA